MLNTLLLGITKQFNYKNKLKLLIKSIQIPKKIENKSMNLLNQFIYKYISDGELIIIIIYNNKYFNFYNSETFMLQNKMQQLYSFNRHNIYII